MPKTQKHTTPEALARAIVEAHAAHVETVYQMIATDAAAYAALLDAYREEGMLSDDEMADLESEVQALLREEDQRKVAQLSDAWGDKGTRQLLAGYQLGLQAGLRMMGGAR